MTPCARCDQPSDALLCHDCLRRFTRDLERAPWLVAQLEVSVTRQARHGDPGGRSRRVLAPEDAILQAAEAAAEGRTGGAVDWRAAEVRNVYRTALVAAVRRLERERDHWPAALVLPDVDHARQARAAATWLRHRAPLMRTHPDGPDLVAAITRAHASALRAINNPAADRWYAGLCLYGDPPCDADLYAITGRPTVTCPKCGQVMDVAARRAYLREEAEDQLVNATDLARAVSWLGSDEQTHTLSRDRIYQWAKRGQLTAHAHRRCDTHAAAAQPPESCRRCQPLYRVGDAIDLLAASVRRKEDRTA